MLSQEEMAFINSAELKNRQFSLNMKSNKHVILNFSFIYSIIQHLFTLKSNQTACNMNAANS